MISSPQRSSPGGARAPLWILWLDGLAGLIVGSLVLALHRPLAPLYGLPPTVVASLGAVNLAYSSLGLGLVRMRRRPRVLVGALIAANYAWTLACAALVFTLATRATVFGLGHLVAEGAFCAALATVEWRRLDALVGPPRGEPVDVAAR